MARQQSQRIIGLSLIACSAIGRAQCYQDTSYTCVCMCCDKFCEYEGPFVTFHTNNLFAWRKNAISSLLILCSPTFCESKCSVNPSDQGVSYTSHRCWEQFMYCAACFEHTTYCSFWLAGLASNLHALRHFVRWKHPKVFAKEHVDSYPPIVFEVSSGQHQHASPPSVEECIVV